MTYRRFRFHGTVLLGNQPKAWISRHSFASRDWFSSQINWGESPWTWYNGVDFSLIATKTEGVKSLKILVEASYYRNGTTQNPFKHVFVTHAHILKR